MTTEHIPPTVYRRCLCGGCTNAASYETKLETIPVPLASCDDHVAFLWWLKRCGQPRIQIGDNMSELHEFVVFGYAYLPVRKTVKAESQAAAKRKAKGSNEGWTVDESPRGAMVDVLSVLRPEGLNAAAMRRVGIDAK